MRQRKAKDLDKRLEACGGWLVRELGSGAWDEGFPGRRAAADGAAGFDGASAADRRPLYAEIGCGKGDFLIAKALQDPAGDYLGIEGQETVLLRAMEKAIRMAGVRSGGTVPDAAAAHSGPAPLDNLRFACCFVNDMTALFTDGSLSGIYLNFSDPWPKARHYKRRLTWRGRLQEYAGALKPGGFLECKTDNDDLFTFTLEEIAACGWTPEIVEWDLHSTDLPAAQVCTEYEKKFRAAGKMIHYVRIAF